jgi:Ca2+-binding RTX toxin-like protein
MATGTIYLNQAWLQAASREAALAVLTEELGHHLDGLLNASDTPGDEGELFAALLLERPLTASAKEAIAADNDQILIQAGSTTLLAEAATITGTALADTLTGGFGDDSITGLGGNDQIDGQAGADIIRGGDGNDTIEGNFGNDSLYGDAGDDTITDNQGANLFDGDLGNDTLTTRSLTGNNTLIGGAGNDTINATGLILSLDGGEGDDELNLNWRLSVGGTSSYVQGGNAILSGGPGRDRFYGYDYSTAELRGGADNDYIYVTGVRDSRLYGDAGDDTIKTYISSSSTSYTDGNGRLARVALVDGGEGNDSLTIEVYLYLSDGRVIASASGGLGDDTISITDSNSFAASGYATVTVDGGAGNDSITVAGYFSTSITTGSGRDTIIFTAPQYRKLLAGAQLLTNPDGSTTAITPEPFSVTDFSTGSGGDVIDYGDLLRNASTTYDGSNPFATGYLALRQNGADTLLSFDPDGTAGSTAATVVAILRNTTSTALVADNFNPNFPVNGSIELPNITLALLPTTVTEDGSSNLVYTFSRSGPTTSALTINYGITGTADASDYTGATPGAGKTITFAAGSATATLTIDPTADSIIEGEETVLLTLAAGTGYTIGTTAAVTGTIVNNETQVSVTVTAIANGNEADGSPAIFRFSRTGSTTAPLSVSYRLLGTAQAGSDYSGATTGTISFSAGSATAELSLLALADSVVDPGETIIAQIVPSTTATRSYLITPGQQTATATITAEGMVVTVNGPSRPGWSRGEAGNVYAFAALKNDGTVVSWGPYWAGGTTPAGLGGVTQIFSNRNAFAALKSDGTVVSWGMETGMEMFTPITTPAGLGGVTKIFSTGSAFAALKSDGTVVCWGDSYSGGTTPAGLGGVTQIFSTGYAFAALKSDGTVVCWGESFYGGTTPAGLGGVTQIFSNGLAFAALKSDGTVVSWGDSRFGGMTPAGLGGVTQIFSNSLAFAALKSDGTVVCWGDPNYGGTTPAGLGGVTQIFSTGYAFAALKSDGTVVCWGDASNGGMRPASLGGVTQIFSNGLAFAALKSDGTVVCWGDPNYGGTTPAGLGGVTQIFSTGYAFAALKSDGTVVCWGESFHGETTPAGLGGVTQIFSIGSAFAALKSDGTVVSWDHSYYTGRVTTPVGLSGVVGFANPYTDDRLAPPQPPLLPSITLAVAPAAVAEDGSSNLSYTFTRTGPTASALTVNYGISGTADATDYTGAAPGTGKTINFAAGAATATLAIDPTADTTIEPDETVALILTAGSGYSIATTTAVVGTILNDDLLAVISLAVSPAVVAEDGTSNLIYTFSRTGPTTSALTVNYTVGGTATLGTDYSGIAATPATKTVSFAANSAIATVTVDPTADAVIEPDETVALTLAAGSGYSIGTTVAVIGTILNDDLPVITLAASSATVAEDGSTNLIYTFSRTGPTTSALTVNYTVSGTATLGTDYSGIAATPATKTVSFAANSAIATVTVDPTADAVIEPDETVALTLAAGSGYSIGTTVAVIGTILNDDLPVITLAVAPTAGVSEDGTANLIYTFSRTGPTTAALTVTYTVGGTATLGTDYSGIAATPATKTVSFAANSAIATVTVDPTSDTTIEPDETVALTLAAGSGYSIGTTAAVVATILNDDISSLTAYIMGPAESSLLLLGTKRINGIGNDLNNTITGNSNNNRLAGLLGADILTGGGSADSDLFVCNSFNESLLGTGSSFDEITDFNSNDRIVAPFSVESDRLTSSLGNLSSLAAAPISGLLNATTFSANSVAAFTVTGQVGTFVAMNDGRAGFQADSDAIVFLKNYSLSATNFVDFA